MIERPAQRAGLELEPGLVARMVEDTVEGTGASGDPLPLLAFALRQLYEKRASPARVTFDDYERIGGVVGALKEEAARTYERLNRQGLGDAVLPMLLELAHVEREREPTGRSVQRARLPAASPVVDAFVEARLLTSEGDEGTIQVAHEALFSEWPLLRDEIARSQQQLIARSQLERDAAEWEEAERDPSYLFSGARLKSTLAAIGSDPGPDQSVADFAAALRRRSRQLTRRRRAAFGTAGLIIVGLLVVSVAVATRKWFGGSSITNAEVTYGQYNRCVKKRVCTPPLNPDVRPASAGKGKNDPVVLIDFAQAASFCKWSGRRLPTERELFDGAHVLPQVALGGWEWTSTRSDGGVVQVRFPASDVDRAQIRVTAPVFTDFDVGFRCTATLPPRPSP